MAILRSTVQQLLGCSDPHTERGLLAKNNSEADKVER